MNTIQNSNYFRNTDLLSRKILCRTLLEKFVGKVPVIVSLKNEDKIKYKLPSSVLKVLVDTEFNITQMLFFLRRKIKINPSDSCYLFTNGLLLPQTLLMRDLYNKYKEKDGFLYFDLLFLESFG